jgi:hypothetical protein
MPHFSSSAISTYQHVKEGVLLLQPCHSATSPAAAADGQVFLFAFGRIKVNDVAVHYQTTFLVAVVVYAATNRTQGCRFPSPARPQHTTQLSVLDVSTAIMD